MMDTIFSHLEGFEEEQLEALHQLALPKTYRQNEYFISAGEIPDKFAIVENGAFRIFYIDSAGNEFTKNFIINGQFLASGSAMFNKEPSRLFIQALKDSKISVINYFDWNRLLEKESNWQITARLITERLYIEKEKRESDLLFYDARTRYLKFLKDYPELPAYIKLKHIASYLNMTPETLSRIRKEINR